MGMKGETPEPGRRVWVTYQLSKLYLYRWIDGGLSKPLSRNWEYFSIFGRFFCFLPGKSCRVTQTGQPGEGALADNPLLEHEGGYQNRPFRFTGWATFFFLLAMA